MPVLTAITRLAHRHDLALAVLALLGALLAHPARADEADEAFYRRASSCAAVLKRDVVAMHERYQRGDAAQRGEILRLTELSFTYVGLAYKRGLRNPRADQMLDDSERVQQRQPAPALRQLSTDCQAEGGRLLANSNALERALVRNRAKARIEKLLAPEDSKS